MRIKRKNKRKSAIDESSIYMRYTVSVEHGSGWVIQWKLWGLVIQGSRVRFSAPQLMLLNDSWMKRFFFKPLSAILSVETFCVLHSFHRSDAKQLNTDVSSECSKSWQLFYNDETDSWQTHINRKTIWHFKTKSKQNLCFKGIKLCCPQKYTLFNFVRLDEFLYWI